jgi:hypothetical protein
MIYNRYWCSGWEYSTDHAAASQGCGISVGEWIAAENEKVAKSVFLERHPGCIAEDVKVRLQDK